VKFGPVVCVPAGTHTTGPNFTLPNTAYAHKTSQVISVKHVLILPEDGSQSIPKHVRVFNCLLKY